MGRIKQKNIVFILFIGLVLIATIYFFSNSNGSLNLKSTGFSVENTNRINRIKISDSEKSVVLEREGAYWRLNGNFQVKQSNMEDFLVTLNRIKLYSPISKKDKKQIASLLQKDGIQVEIYTKSKLLKKYFVSKSEMSKTKTYMMMNKSSEPFIVHIPASKVNLANWFNVNEGFWRNNVLFNYQPNQIKRISIEYDENLKGSYQIFNTKGVFSVYDISNGEVLEKMDTDKLAVYLANFKSITFDDIVNNLLQNQLDSILKSKPFVNITVEDLNGKINSINVYKKPPENEMDEFGQIALMDYVRAYAMFNESNELILIRYQIFDPLFKEIDYFR